MNDMPKFDRRTFVVGALAGAIVAVEAFKAARGIRGSTGLIFVPALTGLGAPEWDPTARGLVIGITRGTTAAHLARATLEEGLAVFSERFASVVLAEQPMWAACVMENRLLSLRLILR